jgi:CRISPR-associated protein Csx14
MSELRVAMDPWNPGQFYACCGLVELLNVASCFAVRDDRPRFAECVLEGVGDEDLRKLIEDLRGARYEFDSQDGQVEKSVQPIWITLGGGRQLKLDWWLDPFYEKAGHLKCWAGQVTTGKLIEELTAGLDPENGNGLFRQPLMTKSKFGIDPRSAWNAQSVGFSPNEHGQDAATFPAVELLGAIGLQGFRPDVKKRESVSYALWKDKLGRLLARRAARAPWDGLALSEYEFRIEKRGQSYKFFTFATQKER